MVGSKAERKLFSILLSYQRKKIDNIQICMDVPFVDHPYLIGPRGRKCQHLMDRYKSLVHFPDSNRRQNGPKLNNVVINGSSKNAEELRFQLRSRTPIRLAIQLQNFPDAFELASRMESTIAERSLPVRMNCSEDYSSAMLKTEWRNEDALISFCDEFLASHSALMFASNNTDIFTMALTILPIVNPWNPEISHWLIEHIFDITGCRVFYPPKEKFADQPPSYFIKGGTAAGVLKAGKFMLGLTMFQVSFIVPNSVQIDLEKIAEWQKELLVHTSIEPVYSTNNSHNNSSGGSSSSRNNSGSQEFLHNRAVLRSFEFCLNSVYFVRSLLLGFKKTVQSSFYNFMSDVKHLIPYSVFSNAQLYYPLYAIDDERSFDWETVGDEFFAKFYGGPYSVGPTVISRQPRVSKSPPTAVQSPSNNLTCRLQELLKIQMCEGNNGRINNRSYNSNNNSRVANNNNNNNNNKSFGSCANNSSNFSSNADDSMVTINSSCELANGSQQLFNYHRFVDSINNGMSSSFMTEMNHSNSTGSSALLTQSSNFYESGCMDMSASGYVGLGSAMTGLTLAPPPGHAPNHPMRQFMPPSHHPHQLYHHPQGGHYLNHPSATIDGFYDPMKPMGEMAPPHHMAPISAFSPEDLTHHYQELEQFHQFHQEQELHHRHHRLQNGHFHPHFFSQIASTPIPEHDALQEHQQQEQHELALQMYHQQQYYQQQMACGMMHVPPLQTHYESDLTTAATTMLPPLQLQQQQQQQPPRQVATETNTTAMSPPPNTPTRLYQRWSRLSQSQPLSGSQRKSASF